MDSKEYKKKIEATFDDVSSRYDENRFFAISAAKLVELIPHSGSLNVLDLSTGTGSVAIEIACKYPDADIVAIDLSRGMLSIAESKAQEKGITNIEFRQGDVEGLVYDSHTFDLVSCGYGLFFYPDMEATFQAICKMVKPGGVFIFSSFTEKAFNPHAELLLKRLEDDYKVEAPSRMRARLKTKQQVETLVSNIESGSIKVIHEQIRYPISIEAWWSLLNSAGFKSLIDQLDEQQLARFKSDHLMDIEGVSTGSFLELNADSLFGVVAL